MSRDLEAIRRDIARAQERVEACLVGAELAMNERAAALAGLADADDTLAQLRDELQEAFGFPMFGDNDADVLRRLRIGKIER